MIVLTDEADTDLETDRLLGQQRTDDQGFYDDKVKENCSKPLPFVTVTAGPICYIRVIAIDFLTQALGRFIDYSTEVVDCSETPLPISI